MPALTDLIVERIRATGPITVAAFMELALYHPQLGYYARAEQRSGRSGDFFTNVDVGPLFGELLAVQFDEMRGVLSGGGTRRFDLVEAAAGNGRLARDILDAAADHHPDLHRDVRLTLVEPGAAARAAQNAILGPHGAKLAASRETLPASITGVIFANELLDALPVHVVTRTSDGLREVYVDEDSGTLREKTGPLSTAAIAGYLDRLGARLETGARAEVGLAAVRWMEEAAAALERGFLLLVDYGHRAETLFSASHSRGTLTSYRAHSDAGGWLDDPGGRDLTAHVNLTAIEDAARAAGLEVLGIVDQTYFLTALGLMSRLDAGTDRASVTRRLAAKTLIMPGGLGSTMKVAIFARGVGGPRLAGLSSGRLT